MLRQARMKRFDVIRNKKMIRKHSIPFGGVVVYGTTQNIVLHISEKVDNLITNQRDTNTLQQYIFYTNNCMSQGVS